MEVDNLVDVTTLSDVEGADESDDVMQAAGGDYSDSKMLFARSPILCEALEEVDSDSKQPHGTVN